MNIYIAFKGTIYTVEWFIDEKGYSQAFEYFEQQSEAQQDKIIALFKLIANHRTVHNTTKFRNEGDKIYAFKSDQHRYLCFFFKGSKIIVTNAFTKKSQKLPSTEKTRALKVYNNYINRVQKGTYYEEEN